MSIVSGNQSLGRAVVDSQFQSASATPRQKLEAIGLDLSLPRCSELHVPIAAPSYPPVSGSSEGDQRGCAEHCKHKPSPPHNSLWRCAMARQTAEKWAYQVPLTGALAAPGPFFHKRRFICRKTVCRGNGWSNGLSKDPLQNMAAIESKPAIPPN